jgi:hypothetical protein
LGHSHGDQDDLAELGGRVLDGERNPIVGAQVKLLDEAGNTLVSTPSANDGSFSLKHSPCDFCTLQVIPDDKSTLASALLEHIPGNINRQFLFTLQQGFRVSGRITGSGKGLKGLLVKVIATEPELNHIHSGGEAKTGRDGSFVMNLTPGSKKLTVQNNKYLPFAKTYERTMVVTADHLLPEIELPGTN